MNTEREVTPPLEQQTVVQEFTDYTKKKRHGHGNDVVDENDVRQVAGCLPLDVKNHRVLLISSRKKNNAWVLVNVFFFLFQKQRLIYHCIHSQKEVGNQMRLNSTLLNEKHGKRPVSRVPSSNNSVYLKSAQKRREN